ncbi:Phage tail assembly chaperone protein, TAC [Rhizobium sp. NFR07]|nr:Phage tail assembly chaperone protein, TAC [Rhizobium sp. NFR07]
MRIGIGGLKWRPADFWSSTMTEFFEAINGHNDAQGGETEKSTAAPTENEMAALLARFG